MKERADRIAGKHRQRNRNDQAAYKQDRDSHHHNHLPTLHVPYVRLTVLPWGMVLQLVCRADFFPDFTDLDFDCVDYALEIHLVDDTQERVNNSRIELGV